MIRNGSILCDDLTVLGMEARAFQMKMLPVPVPMATKRARCPGTAAPSGTRTGESMGVLDPLDVSEALPTVMSGSSVRFRVAKVEPSRHVANIRKEAVLPNESCEGRHSSTMDARSG